MTKTRTIVVAAAVLLASAAGRADYLYWMYDPIEEVAGASYSIAQLYYTENGTYTGTRIGDAEYVYGVGGAVGSATNPIEADLAVFRAAVADPEHFSFYVEVIASDADGKWLQQGDSALWLYSDLKLAKYIHDAGWDAPSITPPVANFAAVPEPTGGALVLLGAALLALRRKRLVASCEG